MVGTAIRAAVLASVVYRAGSASCLTVAEGNRKTLNCPYDYLPAWAGSSVRAKIQAQCLVQCLAEGYTLYDSLHDSHQLVAEPKTKSCPIGAESIGSFFCPRFYLECSKACHEHPNACSAELHYAFAPGKVYVAFYAFTQEVTFKRMLESRVVFDADKVCAGAHRVLAGTCLGISDLNSIRRAPAAVAPPLPPEIPKMPWHFPAVDARGTAGAHGGFLRHSSWCLAVGEDQEKMSCPDDYLPAWAQHSERAKVHLQCFLQCLAEGYTLSESLEDGYQLKAEPIKPRCSLGPAEVGLFFCPDVSMRCRKGFDVQPNACSGQVDVFVAHGEVYLALYAFSPNGSDQGSLESRVLLEKGLTCTGRHNVTAGDCFGLAYAERNWPLEEVSPPTPPAITGMPFPFPAFEAAEHAGATRGASGSADVVTTTPPLPLPMASPTGSRLLPWVVVVMVLAMAAAVAALHLRQKRVEEARAGGAREIEIRIVSRNYAA